MSPFPLLSFQLRAEVWDGGVEPQQRARGAERWFRLLHLHGLSSVTALHCRLNSNTLTLSNKKAFFFPIL